MMTIQKNFVGFGSTKEYGSMSNLQRNFCVIYFQGANTCKVDTLLFSAVVGKTNGHAYSPGKFNQSDMYFLIKLVQEYWFYKKGNGAIRFL